MYLYVKNHILLQLYLIRLSARYIIQYMHIPLQLFKIGYVTATRICMTVCVPQTYTIATV